MALQSRVRPPTTEFILPQDTPPFFLNSGKHPRSLPEPPQSSYVETANQFVERMCDIQGKASDSLTKAAADMKKYYDRRRAHPFPTTRSEIKYGWMDLTSPPLDPQKSLTISATDHS